MLDHPVFFPDLPAPGPPAPSVLMEDSGYVLQEDNSYIYME